MTKVPGSACGYRELARFYADWIAEVERAQAAGQEAIAAAS